MERHKQCLALELLLVAGYRKSKTHRRVGSRTFIEEKPAFINKMICDIIKCTLCDAEDTFSKGRAIHFR